MSADKNVICFGEILMDVFPDGEQIGGAPLNVAVRLSSLGIQTGMISKVGRDRRGEELINFLKLHKVDTRHIAEDKEHPTGVVQVRLSEGGSATYEIRHPAAWDNIEVKEAMKRSIGSADAFVFGSLACRDEISRNALFDLLPLAKFRVLDINLRPPHYDREVLQRLVQQADFIKFNDEEVFEITALLGSVYNSLEQNIQFLSQRINARTLCVTLGRHGAVLFREDRWYYNCGYKVQVKDTVGAGDSFLAALLAKLLTGEKAQQSLDYACAIGALVAAEVGANPELKAGKVENFMYSEPSKKSI